MLLSRMMCGKVRLVSKRLTECPGRPDQQIAGIAAVCVTSSPRAASLVTPRDLSKDIRFRMTHHIAYTSAAPEPVDPGLLASLLKVSVRNNTRDGITGVLLYHDQSYFQILEGEKDVVEACYARIVCDPRHVGVLRLWNQTAEERVFSHWAMGYAGPDQLQLFEGAAQDRLTRFMRHRNGETAGEPVALALARQMYKRFRFGMARYGGPILT